MGEGPKRTVIRATREITVNIRGETYDALLIPRKPILDVDFTQFPEDDPLRRIRNTKIFIEVDLIDGVDIVSTGHRPESHTYRLTEKGAKRLLEAL
jgi:hypothetical protein